MNCVTLFSNGIGHFRRTYQVPAGKEEIITIPFKTDCIGDVAASLQVFGKVRLAEPPSFTPANSNATSLCIDQNNATISLLTQLSGSLITIFPQNKETIGPCQLVGVEKRKETGPHSTVVEKCYVVFIKDGKMARMDLNYVGNIEFNDDSVRTEIDKALKVNFQKIKPDSTLLDLKLAAESDTEASVQYTIPVAAWKMRYAIRQKEGKFTLEGAAIIDNNTDEDWDNFSISVVTGNPISFNTDIAEVVVPKRKMVHLVEGTALGNVDVEEGTLMGGAPPSPVRARSMRGALGAKMSVANYAQFGLESCCESVDDMEAMQYAAEAPGVESKEVGDFCVFTSKEPLTILARKSAVVPMFTVTLDHAGVVLLYKESNHARRPYRAIKFRNETKDTLGKGKTVIYNEGVFSGECVLETSKPGENRMLPHCIENGMKIIKEPKTPKSQRTSLRLADGLAINEVLNTSSCVYRIENKKDEPFKLALEHDSVLMQHYGNGRDVKVRFDGAEIVEQEKLSNGWRLYLEVEAKGKIDLEVVESLLDQQQIRLGDMSHIESWKSDGIPVLTNPAVQECIKIQENIDEKRDLQKTCQSRRQELDAQADRVRRNVAAVGQQSDVTDWVKDLDSTEKEIRVLEKETLPRLSDDLKALQTQLREALKKIDLIWNSEVSA